jgi:hypothetical protein
MLLVTDKSKYGATAATIIINAHVAELHKYFTMVQSFEAFIEEKT